jgi:hypothetical protein
VSIVHCLKGSRQNKNCIQFAHNKSFLSPQLKWIDTICWTWSGSEKISQFWGREISIFLTAIWNTFLRVLIVSTHSTSVTKETLADRRIKMSNWNNWNIMDKGSREAKNGIMVRHFGHILSAAPCWVYTLGIEVLSTPIFATSVNLAVFIL